LRRILAHHVAVSPDERRISMAAWSLELNPDGLCALVGIECLNGALLGSIHVASETKIARVAHRTARGLRLGEGARLCSVTRRRTPS
jgi:hypothetical protein